MIVFLFTANTQITFKPFSISLPYWYKPVGLLLVVIGIFVFGIGENMSGMMQKNSRKIGMIHAS